MNQKDEKTGILRCKICKKDLTVMEAEFECGTAYCKEHFDQLKDNWQKREALAKQNGTEKLKEQRTL